MATTVGTFSAIDDSEVDAESPITESLVTRLRDNSYWIDEATTRTAATSNTLVLTPNQTAGTTQWVEIETLGTNPSTHGVASNTAWANLTARVTGRTLVIVASYDGDTNSGTFSPCTATMIINTTDNTVSASGFTIASVPASITTTTATGDLDTAQVTIGPLTVRLFSGFYQNILASGATMVWYAY